MDSDGCLVAILLFTTSSKGSHIAFRWPARSNASRRLSRPLPLDHRERLDFNYRAAHELGGSPDSAMIDMLRTELNKHAPYQWADAIREFTNEPGGANVSPGRNRSTSLQSAGSAAKSTHSVPSTRDNTFGSIDADADWSDDHDYHFVLGYPMTNLAGSLFRFDRNLCYQRFELTIDELLFIGHPVCIGDDGTWKPKAEPSKADDSDTEEVHRPLKSKDDVDSAALKAFHFVLVLDRPDPSLGGNENLNRFIDVYYRQIVMKVTAALHCEQARDGYVEKEADVLVDLCYESMKSQLCPIPSLALVALTNFRRAL